MTDPRYRRTLEHLYTLRRFGLRPGLEVIRELLRALGNPQREFRAIHVTGSKGKGSVSVMAAGILTAHGRPTGLFTSPHLQSYRERMQIDRRPISPEEVVDGIDRIQSIANDLVARGTLERPPTFFEITTALAFDWFAKRNVEQAVVEVGLGGRLDSTNVLDAPVGVVTTIELEHTDILGTTLIEIAREKAGIFTKGMHAIVGETKREPAQEIDRIASSLGVPVWHLGRELSVEDRVLRPNGQRFSVVTPSRRLEKLQLPFFGSFQPGNAAMAIAAVDRFAHAVGISLENEEIRRGLREAEWRGRLQRFARRPDLFLDVAHTPESARAVAESLGEIYPFSDSEENVLLFGCLGDKRFGEIFERLSPLARTVVVVPVASARSAEPSELRRAGVGKFRTIVQAPDSREGLRLARAATGHSGFTLAIGSDYLIGELLNVLEGRVVDEPDLSDPGQVPSASPVELSPARNPESAR